MEDSLVNKHEYGNLDAINWNAIAEGNCMQFSCFYMFSINNNYHSNSLINLSIYIRRLDVNLCTLFKLRQRLNCF